MSLRAAALALGRRGNPLLTSNSRKAGECIGTNRLATLAPYASAGVTWVSLRAAALALPWHRPPGQVWRRGNPLLTSNSRKSSVIARAHLLFARSNLPVTWDCFAKERLATTWVSLRAAAKQSPYAWGLLRWGERPPRLCCRPLKTTIHSKLCLCQPFGSKKCLTNS